MKKNLQEFKEFAVKGNVVDLAVAVIIGGAFGKIVSSLVADILMPIIDSIFGGVSLRNLKYVLQKAVLNEDGSVLTPAITINIGNFIQTIFDFLVVAIFIFIILKAIIHAKERFKRKRNEEFVEQKDEEEVKEKPSRQEELLSEIRDILKNRNNKE